MKTLDDVVRESFYSGYEKCLLFMREHKKAGYDLALAITSAEEVLRKQKEKHKEVKNV